MPTRLYSVVVDAHDFRAQVRWWSRALDLPVDGERDDEAWIRLPDGPELLFAPVPEPKTVKNRIHLDLGSRSDDDQKAIVERMLSLGATHADIGQRDVPWVVLTDPEGNEFCVLDPRDKYAGARPVAAIVVESADPRRLARFWVEASAYQIHDEDDEAVGLRSASGSGPYLEFVRSPARKRVKNRVHLDVAPFAGDVQEAEADRLVAAGARRIDIGQGGVPWIVMADPDDNEFCVLTPR